DDYPFPDLRLEDPIRAMREISRDSTCTKRIKLRNGNRFTAIEIQRAYLEAAQQYFSRHEPGEQENDILKKWEEVLTLLGEDPMLLDRRVDWVIKKRLLEHKIEKEHLSLNHPKIRLMDIQYHSIDPDRGLFHLFEKHKLVEGILDEEEIERAKITPPLNTRAKIRQEFIRLILAKNLKGSVTWGKLFFGSHPIRVIEIMDPFESSTERLERIFDELTF
ncbi:MAG: proteasome accessory factor PafA2 family protein, partial [Candidatus Tectomicrobia bacterium]|nr:proteasome accessory factor PafA2 family protein [Candidatus Tectomicrobia bacterium]